ncbi:hypothetical protein ACQ4PT_055967 [Festuca glaucescens]
MAAAQPAVPVCPSYRCGQAVNIQYPFWLGSGNATGGAANASHCGYPSLLLECRRGTPVLPLPSGDYAVIRILYGNAADDRTVSVFDPAITSANTTCPHVAGRALALPPGSPPPLSLTKRNSFLTFALNCYIEGINGGNLIPCLQNGRNSSFVFRNGRVPSDEFGFCEQVVTMPVLSPVDDVVVALRAGFELSWTPAAGGQCRKCEKAGGYCGGDRLGVFTCFGGPSKSPGASKTSRGRKLTTFAIAGIIGLTLPFVFCCIVLCMVYWGLCGSRAEADA